MVSVRGPTPSCISVDDLDGHGRMDIQPEISAFSSRVADDLPDGVEPFQQLRKDSGRAFRLLAVHRRSMVNSTSVKD